MCVCSAELAGGVHAAVQSYTEKHSKIAALERVGRNCKYPGSNAGDKKTPEN